MALWYILMTYGLQGLQLLQLVNNVYSDVITDQHISSEKNVCHPSSKSNPCCDGWMQIFKHGPCLKPVCRPGCRGGVCMAPHRCLCRDGSMRRHCHTHQAPVGVNGCRRRADGILLACNFTKHVLECSNGQCHHQPRPNHAPSLKSSNRAHTRRVYQAPRKNNHQIVDTNQHRKGQVNSRYNNRKQPHWSRRYKITPSQSWYDKYNIPTYPSRSWYETNGRQSKHTTDLLAQQQRTIDNTNRNIGPKRFRAHLNRNQRQEKNSFTNNDQQGYDNEKQRKTSRNSLKTASSLHLRSTGLTSRRSHIVTDGAELKKTNSYIVNPYELKSRARDLSEYSKLHEKTGNGIEDGTPVHSDSHVQSDQESIDITLDNHNGFNMDYKQAENPLIEKRENNKPSYFVNPYEIADKENESEKHELQAEGSNINSVKQSVNQLCHITKDGSAKCQKEKNDKITDVIIERPTNSRHDSYANRCRGLSCGVADRIKQVLSSPCRGGSCIDELSNAAETASNNFQSSIDIKSCVMPFCDLRNPNNNPNSIIDLTIDCKTNSNCVQETGSYRNSTTVCGPGCSLIENLCPNVNGCVDKSVETFEDNPCQESQVFVEDPVTGYKTCQDMGEFLNRIEK